MRISPLEAWVCFFGCSCWCLLSSHAPITTDLPIKSLTSVRSQIPSSPPRKQASRDRTRCHVTTTPPNRSRVSVSSAPLLPSSHAKRPLSHPPFVGPAEGDRKQWVTERSASVSASTWPASVRPSLLRACLY